MKTIIGNKITIINPTTNIRLWAMENLVVTNPTYATLKRLGKEDTIKWKHIPKDMYLYAEKAGAGELVFPFGVLNAIWPMIKDYPYTLKLNNNEEIGCKNDEITQPLYDYQEEAVSRMIKAKGGVLVGGCGSGKTNCGIEIAHRIGKKFLWITHTHDLLKQTYSRAKFLYPNLNLGTITDGKINLGRDGTIATVQTLATIDKDIYANDFDVVIVDECHHISGSPTLLKYFSKVINNIPARYKFGLTATPTRGDTMIKSMYSYIGCNTRGEFAPEFEISRSNVKTMTAEHIMVELDTKMGYEYYNADGTFDYNNLINFLSENPYRNGIILEKICELDKQNRKQLVLCSRVNHCEELYNKLLEKGIKAELLVGKVSAKKREQVLNDSSGNWNVIVATYSLAKEGLDVPILDTLHLTTPQKDKALVVQSAGRIERYIEDKIQPQIYDYVDVNVPYCLGAYKKRKNMLKGRK